MAGQDPTASVSQNYRRFAKEEARGRSPAYEALAEAVADDIAVITFLNTLPPPKRQPNLLFAAARYLLERPPDIATLRALVDDPGSGLADVMLSRRTQTNEPARCATLLPALAQLPQPLALLEVGASAGLTLLVDRYSYDYAGYRVAGTDPVAPTMSCTPVGHVPLPNAVPTVAWRVGLDLNPLDITKPDDVRWLTCLLWPGERDRERRLAEAVATALREPPDVRAGDLVDDLPALVAQAPSGATLVVYHSAVLAYVDEDRRRQFAHLIQEFGVVWLANEGPGILPDVTVPAYDGSPFLLTRNRVPLAFTDPHGTWLRWLS
jgi:hypothetical protein